MRRITSLIALTFLLAACGGGGGAASSPPASSAAPKPASAAASAAASAKPAASAEAKPAASGAASGAAQTPPSFTDGTVASIDATKLTLTEGSKSFTIAQNTTFRKLQKENPTDVKVGQFVAITAKQQPDNTMLASFLRLQDTPGPAANQFPMDYTANGQAQAGNMMINAPIKSTDANGMVVTLPGGDLTVKYAPGIQIVHQVDGAASDVKAGGKVLVISRGDAAVSIGIYV